MDLDPLKVPAYMRRSALSRRAAKPTRLKLSALKPKAVRKKKKVASAPMPDPFAPEASVVRSEPIWLEPMVETPDGPVLAPLGIVTHYYDRIQVAIIKLSAPLAIGERVGLPSDSGVFTQTVNSMQIDRVNVDRAEKGAEIGLKVHRPVNPGEIAYRVA